MHILKVNSETGEVEVILPEYEEDEPVSATSILFVALAQKISNDPDWAEGLVDSLLESVQRERENGPSVH